MSTKPLGEHFSLVSRNHTLEAAEKERNEWLVWKITSAAAAAKMWSPSILNGTTTYMQ